MSELWKYMYNKKCAESLSDNIKYYEKSGMLQKPFHVTFVLDCHSVLK